jgi:6-pyruvoyltetrahydropterin/6-carboxytetrahydropterin synthase
MPWLSTKTYGHEEGLSCCFRQHKADSHCSLLHGYALSFKFTFRAELDDRTWVVDFGGLKELRMLLKHHFDHTLCVAEDDPMKDELCSLQGLGVANVLVLPAVGCEMFARYACKLCEQVFKEKGWGRRVSIMSVECAEHGANSAIYLPDHL